MKSLITILAIFFLSLSSFALTPDALFNTMKKAEGTASKVAAPKHGEYFFGDNEARMLIYDEASLMHALQVHKDGVFQHFTVTSEADKHNLRGLIDQGYTADALVTYAVQSIEVDGVQFKLIARIPNSKTATLQWRAAQYSNGPIGLPGVRAKYNRTITFTTDLKTGKLLNGEIYQVSLTGLFQPEVLPLVIR